MPGRKRVCAFPALEGPPECHREPQRDRPHRARSPCPGAIRAQATRVKLLRKLQCGSPGQVDESVAAGAATCAPTGVMSLRPPEVGEPQASWPAVFLILLLCGN